MFNRAWLPLTLPSLSSHIRVLILLIDMEAPLSWTDLPLEIREIIRRTLEEDGDIGRDMLQLTCRTEWRSFPAIWNYSPDDAIRYYARPCHSIRADERNRHWFVSACHFRYNTICEWIVGHHIRRYGHRQESNDIMFLSVALHSGNFELATALIWRGFHPEAIIIHYYKLHGNAEAQEWLKLHNYDIISDVDLVCGNF
jgi:hypothetical protein